MCISRSAFVVGGCLVQGVLMEKYTEPTVGVGGCLVQGVLMEKYTEPTVGVGGCLVQGVLMEKYTEPTVGVGGCLVQGVLMEKYTEPTVGVGGCLVQGVLMEKYTEPTVGVGGCRYYFEYLMGSTYPPTDKFEAVFDITGQAACSVFVPPRSWRIIFRLRGRLFERLIDFNHVYIDNTTFILRTRDGITLIGGGERVGVMLVCGTHFQISAKKGGWVLQMVQKEISP